MPIFNISDISTTGLTVSGSTLISGGNGTILTVRGQNNDIINVSDTISDTVFNVGGGTTQFSVLTAGTRIHTFLFDSSNSTGSTNQILSSTPSGILWANASSGGSGTDIFVTGGTYSNGVIQFRNNTGGTFTVTNLFSGTTDVYVTGGTYSNGTATFRNNTGGTFSVTGYFTGSTDVFVTGGTYGSGVITFRNNTGGTFSVTNLFSGTTDVYVTGGTYGSGVILFRNNTGGTFSVTNLFSGTTDVYVTGGTYSNGTATFRNNTGGTFTLTGLYTGSTDVFVTGGTYSNGTATFRNNTGGTFTLTGLYTGSTDVYVTGGTYNSGVILFRNNTGGTFSVTNLFSGTTDVYVTGGTYNSGTGVATFVNNTGGTFTVTGFSTGSGGGGGASITAFTYNNNVFSITESSGSPFTVLVNTVTGWTVNGNLTVTGNSTLKALSATTGQFSGTGSNILVVKGSLNDIVTINDNVSNTLFSVATTGGTTQFSVLTAGTRIHTFLFDSSNSTGSTNQVLTSTSTGATWTTQSSQATPEYRQISLVTNLANAGDTGTINQTLVGIGYSGTIVGWYITCYPAATVSVDVWKANGAVPTIANTITAAAKPSITAANLNSSLTPTGWTTAVSAGDYFMLNVDSNNLATYINLQLLISI